MKARFGKTLDFFVSLCDIEEFEFRQLYCHSQQILVHHPIGTIHKIMQYIIFLSAQLQRFSQYIYQKTVGKQLYIAQYNAMFTIAMLSPKHTTYSGRQLSQMERLCQIIIGP